MASIRPSPLTLVALTLVGGGLFWMSRADAPADPELPCDPLALDCQADPSGLPTGFAPARAPEVYESGDICVGSGYLCAELEQRDRIRIQHWTGFSGTLVVHVPRPDFENAADAQALQRAAGLGIRAWNGQPFPIVIDTRGDRDPHFSIQWTQSLGGTQLGVARTQWSPSTGLTVVSVELSTRSPYSTDRVLDAQQVRLIAAHEMGHALGLGHSDSSRDVMYPTNTATSVSAQDRRTMEVLYSLPDGAEIRR